MDTGSPFKVKEECRTYSKRVAFHRPRRPHRDEPIDRLPHARQELVDLIEFLKNTRWGR